ncbi:MAG: septal ring lytic transglycosylase RlpA family protein [Bacteroidaceae bacterium]|nr:septal ring lytic transglycosylase RlpA family protein [Bacteroidaceae bacterium]
MKLYIYIVFCALACALLPLQAAPKADKCMKGKASYYHDKFHGRKMANGQVYHRDSFTCAHLKYPLGTVLKVRNVRNQKECVVRVTDRGPYSKKYIIDLSRAAARHLGILGAGWTEVEITPYYSGTIPYKLGPAPLPEIPELNIQYDPAAVYPCPAWMNDSVSAVREKVYRDD